MWCCTLSFVKGIKAKVFECILQVNSFQAQRRMTSTSESSTHICIAWLSALLYLPRLQAQGWTTEQYLIFPISDYLAPLYLNPLWVPQVCPFTEFYSVLHEKLLISGQISRQKCLTFAWFHTLYMAQSREFILDDIELISERKCWVMPGLELLVIL